MKPTTYLHIPTPCHEDWDKMTENQQGRFCSSCSKTVVDFQMMTDQQIINYFTKAEGKTCGRFSSDQLNRSLEETKIEKKKGWQWLMASVASFFFFINRSNAQTLQGKVAYKPQTAADQQPQIKGEPIRCKPSKVTKAPVLLGTTAAIKPNDLQYKPAITLQQAVVDDTVIASKKPTRLIGSVTDEKGNAVADALVETTLAGTKYMNSTNAKGDFVYSNPAIKHGDSVVMKFSCLGYEAKTVSVIFDESQLELHIQLKGKPQQLPEVVVSSGLLDRRTTIVVGGIGYYRSKSIKKADTVAVFVRKILKTQGFKMFPNPASKGMAVNLTINDTGGYAVQLLDSESRLLHIENITVNGKQETKPFSIPSTIASGLYYVRIINEKTKKQYLDKLIVQ